MKRKTEPKKTAVYASCAVIALIALVMIVAVVAGDTSGNAEHPPRVETVETTGGETVEVPVDTEGVIKFDGLELVFGEYSFTAVDNMFSEHNGKDIVRIPVTVTNTTKSAHSLNYFYYKLFGTTGIESEDVGSFFEDDMMSGTALLSGKSYTRYFHILYDGDGVYTIVLDDMLFDKKTVEINVKK